MDYQTKLFTWARSLQSIAQAGLTYTDDPFDRQRFEQLLQIAAELYGELSDAPTEIIHKTLAMEQGYLTPKIDVRAVVFQNDRVLMVKESSDGCWSLPGGWADAGESAGEMAVREVFEETGYQVRPVKLLSVWDRDKHPHKPLIWAVYKVFILCELVGGEARTSIETESVAFFGQNELPELSIDRVTDYQMRRIFMHLTDPDLPADFD